ncbi:MAG: HEPN domain-containing protein [Actinomycetota bacterium]|nr:HEPN domain-containing protein [Actinomycetota bacterium]
MSRRDQRDVAQSLATKAAGDEQALTKFRHSDLPDDIVGFHAQQAVEKQLKSLCAWRRLEYPYTHDIAALIEVLEDDGIDVPSDVRTGAELTPWAVQFRYEPVRDAALDRDRAIEIVTHVRDWCYSMRDEDLST